MDQMPWADESRGCVGIRGLCPAYDSLFISVTLSDYFSACSLKGIEPMGLKADQSFKIP